jgi:eukaryotic-like serine/threonine-protein kinase
VIENPCVEIAQRARAAAALIALDSAKTPAGPAWSTLRLAPDPGLRVELSDWLVRSQVDAEVLVNRLDSESDVSVRRQLIQTLGALDHLQLPTPVCASLTGRLAAMYRDDPDPGVHSSLTDLLRRWGIVPVLERINADRAGKPREWRHWYVIPAGLTMAVLDVPEMHRPLPPKPGQPPARFAIATTETPLALFQQFDPDHAKRRNKEYNPAPPAHPDAPADTVSYFDAARFCNWLGQRDGIPQTEWCYQRGEDEGVWLLVSDFLSRRGYRLPTIQEWEYAARAGTTTDRYFGQDLTYIDDYAWHRENTGPHPEPIGRLRPNDFGLFDAIGNLEELCFNPRPTLKMRNCKCRSLLETGLCEASAEAQRGSSFTGPTHSQSVRERPTERDDVWPNEAWIYTGFRVVKIER